MTKYTKWIAGGLGWALGGPIGGILGFVFGSMVDGISTDGSISSKTQEGDFSVSLLILSAAIMKADGKVVKAELDYVKSFYTRNFGIDKATQDMLMLREILKQNIDISEVCLQIRSNMAYAERLQLLHYLFGIANADGMPHASELQMIAQMSYYLGINSSDLNSIQSMFIKDTNSAYKILEITPEATDEEVKKAYRKMALKHHPDKVSHLGEDVRKAGEEKFREIQAAYDDIKRMRNLN